MPRRLLLLVLILVATALGAQGSRLLNVEDIWAVTRVGAPSLNPEGSQAVVSLARYEGKKQEPLSDLWILPTDGKGQPRQLTAHPAGDTQPVWSPDGKWIAFLSKRDQDEATQIYLISPEGGEAKRLTQMPTGANGLKWFADGRRLAFWSLVWPDLDHPEAQGKRLKERAERTVKATVVDSTAYRYWDHWVADGRLPQVFEADLASGAVRNLLQGTGLSLPRQDPSAAQYDLSPDGQELALATDLGPDFGFDPDLSLVVMDLKTRIWKNLTPDHKGHDSTPRYSPDGTWLAFLRSKIPHFYADRTRACLVERSSGRIRELTETWDRSAEAPFWSPDSRTLFFTAEDQARRPLFALPLAGGTPRKVQGGTVSDPALSASGKVMAFLRSSLAAPSALFACGPEGQSLRQVDHVNDALTRQWKLGPVEEMTFPGYRNEPVHMWVVFPPDFDKSKRYPLLQAVHGGPHSAWEDAWSSRWNLHLLASRGYIVAAVNYHGSTGWGQAFCDSITGDYGKMELADTEKATDLLLSKGYVDPARLAAAGASYGGYLMAWMNGHTDRYKAMVCHAGVYDWTAQMASDVVRGRQRALKGFPWENPEDSARQSAHTYAARFKTPTLVIHGELDYRVPVTQGFEYYNTLRMKGVPARLIHFPDENHWILKPDNHRFWIAEIQRWLEAYVQAGPR